MRVETVRRLAEVEGRCKFEKQRGGGGRKNSDSQVGGRQRMCNARRLLGYQRPVSSRSESGCRGRVDADGWNAWRPLSWSWTAADVAMSEHRCGVEHDGPKAYDLTGQKCQRVWHGQSGRWEWCPSRVSQVCGSATTRGGTSSAVGTSCNADGALAVSLCLT